MSAHLTSATRSWIPFALTSILLSITFYGAIQQALRLSANNPQIQMAEDTANALSNGTPLYTLTSSRTIDIAKSISPYIIVLNQKGIPLSSTALLNGKIPTLPSGVLHNVSTHGEQRFTWQPQPNIRSAVVITSFSSKHTSGYVLAGRSLREVEDLEGAILHDIALGLLVTLIGSFASIFLIQKTRKNT